jgi:hypothetical protein
MYNTMNPLNPTPLTFGQPVKHYVSTVGPGAGRDLPDQPFLVNPASAVVRSLWITAVVLTTTLQTVELRRRMSRGLLVQANYTFGKAINNTYASSLCGFRSAQHASRFRS